MRRAIAELIRAAIDRRLDAAGDALCWLLVGASLAIGLAVAADALLKSKPRPKA